MQTANAPDIIEYPGDENGPIVIARFLNISYLIDAYSAISRCTTPIGYPAIRIHEKDANDFYELADKIFQDYVDEMSQGSGSNYYPPFSDALARMNVMNNQ